MKNKHFKSVGLIIKNRSLAMVEVEIRKNIPVVTNYSKILLEEGIVENDCIILNKESFQEAVKKLLAGGVGGPINTKTLFVSLPEEKIFSHQISIMRDKIGDVEYIKEVAEDFIPIELNQAVFDYKVIHENPGGKTVIVNVVATQNSIAQPIIDALEEIGLEVTKMNVDIYCLVKSFHNCLNDGKGAFLLINMEPARDFLAIVSTDDRVFENISKTMRSEMFSKLKALLGLSSDDELRQLLINTRRGSGMSEEQKAVIKDSFKDYFKDLSDKILQLIEATKSEENIEIKRIYLTGMLSALPGMEEILSKLLPDVPIKKNIQFLEVPLEVEGDALEGIGLCLNGCLPDDKNNFNLLPERRKDEIFFKKVYPRVRIFSFLLAIFLAFLALKTGINAGGSYLDYRLSSREIAILNEQTLNPYISETAKQKMALKQSREQMLLIINDLIPVSHIIRNLDSYNKNEIALVSIDYKDLTSEEVADISLKAKTAGRDVTEKWVAALESDDRYEKVNSPLSNLVGKGERFVNLTLKLNKAKAIESFKAASETTTSTTPETVTKEENDLQNTPK